MEKTHASNKNGEMVTVDYLFSNERDDIHDPLGLAEADKPVLVPIPPEQPPFRVRPDFYTWLDDHADELLHLYRVSNNILSINPNTAGAGVETSYHAAVDEWSFERFGRLLYKNSV